MKTFHICLVILLMTGLSAIGQTTNPPPPNSYKEITLANLMEKLRKGDNSVVILDVRSPGEFHDTSTSFRSGTIGRLKGAINVDIQELRAKPETIKQLYPYRNKEIYVICSHSYRSRVVSNMLLADGFSNVTNTKGGMSEWYRDYPDLEKYMKEFYITTSQHVNTAPVTLYKKLAAKEDVVLMSFTDTQQILFDTNVKTFYKHFPGIKNAMYFTYADSLNALQKAKAANGKPIITFNTITGGGAEMAEWLTGKGILNVSFLIGGLNGFYEYMQNYQPKARLNDYFTGNSEIMFFTAPSFCRYIKQNKDFQIVDIRANTLFNKITNGTKLDYKSLEGAVNFPANQSADVFVQRFPDKKKLYIFTQTFLATGVDLADELISRGYSIGWLIGGNERWEWYTNNIEWFECKNYFVK